MIELIANYLIKEDSSCTHRIKLYSDGTTLEVLDEFFDDVDEDLDVGYTETEGTYRNSPYKQQLKNLVIQNHRSGKLKELPRWL
ncbi:hypothetical protein Riv7116_3556 [Rivularia sp. PCC 7116]|uniref:hypothetical protein n=1 Tax=Rivularia sp. PCC 7116 TaxID=373994 RepID=UPI00029EE840|nr:hypothetical protein [Rivularia sp. PCC 7116]AFY56008.1 hypothetical protein Riv7116_3556 [Rivularia sp. PCC 7116]